MVFKMKGLKVIRLRFLVMFLSDLSTCAPGYGILQNVTGKISLSWSLLFS